MQALACGTRDNHLSISLSYMTASLAPDRSICSFPRKIKENENLVRYL
jgi:hypothetical protein